MPRGELVPDGKGGLGVMGGEGGQVRWLAGDYDDFIFDSSGM